ncbi:hypothetical protein PUN28_007790 [Cardiocondyla obscurior]|uniref:phospholipase A1 n=1 Tax=Cardiocondyla obscurior TaxID=286306 RepID=A0AAW2FWV9_9HYME
MINYTFRQFAFIIVIIYTTLIGGVFTEDELKSIFLRVFTGTTLQEYVDYSVENASAITSRINKSKPTVIYIHGYTEHVEKESVQTVIQAYLKRNDHNTIAVDYGILANNTYVSLLINAPRIGNVLATALEQMKFSGLDTERLHIVAHSMGSQISGYLGRNVSFSIPRITGLDPAGPLYNLLQPSLSASDARFVDIIHTDYGFYGVTRVDGTVNFFPNSGRRIQPGCPQNPIFFSKDDFCSHHRSWRFYAESLINESAFIGVQCSSLFNFVSNECINNTRIVMGYATPKSARGTVYLVTNDDSPFGLGEKGVSPN